MKLPASVEKVRPASRTRCAAESKGPGCPGGGGGGGAPRPPAAGPGGAAWNTWCSGGGPWLHYIRSWREVGGQSGLRGCSQLGQPQKGLVTGLATGSQLTTCLAPPPPRWAPQRFRLLMRLLDCSQADCCAAGESRRAGVTGFGWACSWADIFCSKAGVQLLIAGALAGSERDEARGAKLAAPPPPPEQGTGNSWPSKPDGTCQGRAPSARSCRQAQPCRLK